MRLGFPYIQLIFILNYPRAQSILEKDTPIPKSVSYSRLEWQFFFFFPAYYVSLLLIFLYSAKFPLASVFQVDYALVVRTMQHLICVVSMSKLLLPPNPSHLRIVFLLTTSLTMHVLAKSPQSCRDPCDPVAL